ncbi:MAG: hypothetical protein Q8Q06_04810 [bacterium]|nr:hypothetical protein [bacterium]
MSSIGILISEQISEATKIKSEKMGLENAKNNSPYFCKTICDLPVLNHPNLEKPAIVIVGGPSLHRKNPVAKIIASGFRGDIVTTDGSLGYCLRNGLVPDYVVSLDPHPKRIVRWFGDTELETRPEDDYFERQDLDKEHWKNQEECNQQLIKLINEHGKRIKAILSTSVDASVTKRCIESRMEIYWWNPLYDDPQEQDSISKSLFESNRIPCMVTGGNVGTAAWILAHSVLKNNHVAVVGMDLGYAPGTPLLNTQYYYELLELLGNRVAEVFIEVYNPHINETWFTDPTYYWYRKVFLDLAGEANCVTYNCTEGGTLFGEPIHFTHLSNFLSKFSKHGG